MLYGRRIARMRNVIVTLWAADMHLKCRLGYRVVRSVKIKWETFTTTNDLLWRSDSCGYK